MFFEYDMRILCCHIFVLTVFLLCCVAHSAENNQPGTPPVENVPTLEHSKSAPMGKEAAQQMATDAVVETAKAATPDVGTSVAAPEPWMNHVSNFLLDPFSCRSVRIFRFLLNPCARSPSTTPWQILPRLMSRWSRRGTPCAPSSSGSVVSSPFCFCFAKLLFAMLDFVEY